jgi:hypothetical protein
MTTDLARYFSYSDERSDKFLAGSRGYFKQSKVASLFAGSLLRLGLFALRLYQAQGT